MKVKDLIERLQQYPEDYTVGLWNWFTVMGGGGCRHLEMTLNPKADEFKMVTLTPQGGIEGHMPEQYHYLKVDTQNRYEILSDTYMTFWEADTINRYIEPYGDWWVREDLYPELADRPVPEEWVKEY